MKFLSVFSKKKKRMSASSLEFDDKRPDALDFFTGTQTPEDILGFIYSFLLFDDILKLTEINSTLYRSTHGFFQLIFIERKIHTIESVIYQRLIHLRKAEALLNSLRNPDIEVQSSAIELGRKLYGLDSRAANNPMLIIDNVYRWYSIFNVQKNMRKIHKEIDRLNLDKDSLRTIVL